jgi:hypothetical protein
MANSTLKTVGIIAGIYALWYIWRENKDSQAAATPTAPAETPQQILQKLVTTNPLSKAPLMLDDIKTTAKAIYTPVKGAVTTVTNTLFQQPIATLPPTANAQVVAAPSANFTGLAGLDGDNLLGFQAKATGFVDNAEVVTGVVPSTTGINAYCKACTDSVVPKTELAIFNR